MVAGLGDGAYAMGNSIYVQCDELKARDPKATVQDLLKQINWQQTLTEGGINFAITSIAAGVVLYAQDHPRFVNFAQKLKLKVEADGVASLQSAGLSLKAIEELFEKLGFDKDTIQRLLEKAGVRRSVANSITVEGNFYKWTNKSGTEIKWPIQDKKSIDNAIDAALESGDIGKRAEGKVADYVRKFTEVKGFAQKLKNAVGEFDIVTDKVIIEVKKSWGQINPEQMEKFTDDLNEKFLNPNKLKTIIFVDEAFDSTKAYNQKKIEELQKIGVEIIWELDKLDDLLK